MEGHHYLYLGLALVSLLVMLAKRRRSATAHGHGLRLPPGPWQLPIIGSLHHMIGKLPHHAMRDLARRHGPLMLLRIGEVPTLVVSSREAAREVMKTHDAVFATRPLSPTMRAITKGGLGIIMAPYGAHWRQLRRITITKLLSARRVLSFRAVREEEAAAMLRACAAAAAGSRTVDMRERLSALITDTTMRAAMGDRFKDREVFLRALDRAIVLASGFNPADLWPSSRIVSRLSGAVRRCEEIRDTSFRILDGIIEEHLERMGSGGGGEVEDLLDVLLKVQQDGELPIPLDMDVIKVVISDIFAGSETTAPTLEWAMAELVQNPEVMERATAEVRHAFAAHGSVREDKLAEAELRYLPLVIRETLRLHTPLPFLIPQACQEPCRVLGYDVPRGITVMVNAWALGRDERYWPGDPDAFRPERFEAGGGTADFKGADFELLPFGAGRRMCPGMGFALANMDLALASLLFHFDWEAPGDAELDMTEALGLTAHRKARLLLRPILRVPVPGV
ncbi:premnaspirodiene oxygenase-like [Panicum miliaceum]|uniref:Premnaspirodiene oxygenase-like n=1 Tax=Panicum miliaceum TaxID=4540 RepID=A0A3L6RH59_PANMI|nr:premnaspirodiene oxygenase-like [Panicum miliaceum]